MSGPTKIGALAGALASLLLSVMAPAKAATRADTEFASVYRASIVGTLDERAPVNSSVNGRRSSVRLQASPIGAISGESTLGIDAHGNLFSNGYDLSPGPLYSTTTMKKPIVRVSSNAGRTWRSTSPTVGALPDQVQSTDPLIWVDPQGRRLFDVNLQALGLTRISFSDDGGVTWVASIAKQTGVEDHPTLIAAPPPRQHSVTLTDPNFHKIVYWCTNAIGFTSCATSTDGGQIFIQGPPLFLDKRPCSGATGHLAADADGRVYLGSSGCGTPELETTEDGGATWQLSTISRTVLGLGHDVEIAVDAAGVLYAAWIGQKVNLPYMAVSRDHGKTWGPSLMIAPPGVNRASYVVIRAGAAGRVAVSFTGTVRSSPTNATPSPSAQVVGDGTDPATPWRQFVTVTTDANAPRPIFESNAAVVMDTGSTIIGRCGTGVSITQGCLPGGKDFLDMQLAPNERGRIWATTPVSCLAGCPNDSKMSTASLPGYAYLTRQIAGPHLVL